MSAMHLKNVFSISFLSQQIRAVGTRKAIASIFNPLQQWGRLCKPYYYISPGFLDFPSVVYPPSKMAGTWQLREKKVRLSCLGHSLD